MMTFQVGGMTCGSCAVRIQRAIALIDDEARVEVDVPGQAVRVSSDASDAELVDAIRNAGYEVQTAPVAASYGDAREAVAAEQAHGTGAGRASGACRG